MLGKWRKNKPKYIPNDIWNSWKPHWETPEFKVKSEKCSKSCLTETGGPGAGPSGHIGGSIAPTVHAKRLEVELWRPSLPHEVLEVTPLERRIGNSWTKIHLQEVGGVKKHRVYGLGSQASVFFGHSSTSSSFATSLLQEQDGENIDARIQEMLNQRMKELEMRYKQELQQQQQLMQEKLQQQVACSHSFRTYSSASSYFTASFITHSFRYSH
ncbi:hypothetical protein JCGZ_17174 [Jatropha curcas]|uniref:Uncharacterized protein n=1 Tax=Jatropha curcas TaxID=180498 RepID=A0A067LAX8_JATCU|nr:hypothetical protein JCGZ_17174 [Jatropha curcas]